MEKHENNLDKLLKAELEKEAGEIMEEMDSDESLQDISFRKRHVATTIRAFHKTHKYIRTSCFIRLFFYTDEFLHQFKGFFINDRFVGVPYYDPFFFRNCNRLLILK